MVKSRWLALLQDRPESICLLMLVGLFPLLYQFVLFHPDERYYVDAALVMIDSGDYLTPRYPAGELRLRKPVVPYWFVAGGMQLFGVNPLGTRIAFALAGCALVWVSWKTSFLIFRSNLAALLTAVTMICHPAVLISAPRSVPDICLALFIALSCYGFVGIIHGRRASWGFLAAAYGGGAIAVLSKGLPAAAFVGLATVFLMVRERQLFWASRGRFAAAILLSATLGLSWFVWMWAKHGGQLADQFVGDQVGSGRFALGPVQVITQSLVLVALLAASFLPALIMLVQGRRHLQAGETRTAVIAFVSRSEIQLLLVWCVFFALAATAINHVTMRYLLPLVGPLAVLLGGALAGLPQACRSGPLRSGLALSLATLGLAGLAFMVLHWQQRVGLAAVVGVGSVAAAISCWLKSKTWQEATGIWSIGASVSAAVGLAALASYPVIFPSLHQQVALELADSPGGLPLLLIDRPATAQAATAQRTAVFPGHRFPTFRVRGESHAAKLRIALGGQRPVVLARQLASEPIASDYSAVLSLDPQAAVLANPGWELELLPFGLDHEVPWATALLAASVSETIAQHRVQCVLAQDEVAPPVHH